jgi:DNA-binding transcriptional MerR regulator
MGNIRIFYEADPQRREEILELLDNEFSLKPTYVEAYITMRGTEDSDIETVRMSLESDVIKIMVVLHSDNLLEKFNEILGTPTRIKGRR